MKTLFRSSLFSCALYALFLATPTLTSKPTIVQAFEAKEPIKDLVIQGNVLLTIKPNKPTASNQLVLTEKFFNAKPKDIKVIIDRQKITIQANNMFQAILELYYSDLSQLESIIAENQAIVNVDAACLAKKYDRLAFKTFNQASLKIDPNSPCINVSDLTLESDNNTLLHVAHINAENVYVSSKNNTTIYVSGETKKLAIKGMGTGTIWTNELRAEQIDLDIKKEDVFARPKDNGRINITPASAGSLTYYTAIDVMRNSHKSKTKLKEVDAISIPKELTPNIPFQSPAIPAAAPAPAQITPPAQTPADHTPQPQKLEKTPPTLDQAALKQPQKVTLTPQSPEQDEEVQNQASLEELPDESLSMLSDESPESQTDQEQTEDEEPQAPVKQPQSTPQLVSPKPLPLGLFPIQKTHSFTSKKPPMKANHQSPLVAQKSVAAQKTVAAHAPKADLPEVSEDDAAADPEALLKRLRDLNQSLGDEDHE